MKTTNSYEFYGVPSHNKDVFIKTIIEHVCFIFGNGANDNADLLIAETIKSETNNADALDYSKAYGEGLGQFDKGSFEDVITRTRTTNKGKVILRFGIDLDKANYDDLRYNSILSIIMIRLKYILIPGEVPVELTNRYAYYKKYYNSEGGKATLNHFKQANGYILA